jgi:hypothetical protein
VARGEILTEAIKQATKQLDTNKASLAVSIHEGIVAEVLRDLGIEQADPKMPFLPKEKSRTYQQTAMQILEEDEGEQPRPFRDSESE